MVYKDRKIIELDAQIEEKDRSAMDLRELVNEKEEVIRGRDKAIQLLQATIAERERTLRDHESIVARLTLKVDAYEQHGERPTQEAGALPQAAGDLNLVTSQIKELQRHFDAAFTEKEKEVSQLETRIVEKDVLLSELQSNLVESNVSDMMQ